MELFGYQERGVVDIATAVLKCRKAIFQLPTGGGKTVTFAAICDRFTKRNPQSVLIAVHREELLEQAIKALDKWYGIKGQRVIAGMRRVPPARVYVGMVESLEKRLHLLQPVGLLIIDETHRGEFKKLHKHFETQLVIGFTATPIAASKKDPLLNYYSDIVVGPSVKELIKMGSLTQNVTYAISGINRKQFNSRGAEFDDREMGIEFSKPRHIKNTLAAYKQHAEGTKAIIFNSTIEHSLLVMQEFLDAGYDCRHIDGESVDRVEIFKWYANTPGAILCNVGIATTGYDEPTIQTVIVNKSILAIPLWLQCTGRGSRIHESKRFFTILDLGDNVKTLGDWSHDHDWKDIFFNPKKKRDGTAPVKDCPQCGAVIPASARVCQYCGYEFPVKEREEDTQPLKLKLVTDGINLDDVIRGSNHARLYNPFYKLGYDIIDAAEKEGVLITKEAVETLHNTYQELARNYIHTTGAIYTQKRRERAKTFFYSQLNKRFANQMSQLSRDVAGALVS